MTRLTATSEVDLMRPFHELVVCGQTHSQLVSRLWHMFPPWSLALRQSHGKLVQIDQSCRQDVRGGLAISKAWWTSCNSPGAGWLYRISKRNWCGSTRTRRTGASSRIKAATSFT